MSQFFKPKFPKGYYGDEDDLSESIFPLPMHVGGDVDSK
jgi:hypothetical protein